MASPSPPLTPPTSDSESELKEPHHLHVEFSFSSSDAQSRTRAIPLPTSSPHPFAASTKANRAPPSYEKKLFTPPVTPPEPSRKKPSVETRELQRYDSRLLCHASPSLDDSEQNLWDAAISSAVDGAKGKLDLSGSNLTCIPPHIIDLKKLVVLSKFSRSPQTTASVTPRSFTRSVTAPAHLASAQASRSRPFLPTTTTNNLRFTTPMRQKPIETHSKCEIELYLMRNAIRVLPRELFCLDTLVVLSLRQNMLTSLPPAIGNLTRLRELNVANNRLTYLPSEMLNLRLTSLHLHPNPFMPAPPGLFDTTRRRTFGPLERKSFVPTLSEFLLRFLLAPATPKANSPTRLEASMTEPLETLLLPDHFQRIVRASTRHTLASEKDTWAEDDVTSNVCQNPDHVTPGVLRGVEISTGRFHKPMETMMEWVGVIAGVQVAESPQASVPVLWRGCSKGCLAFLEYNLEEDVAEDHDAPGFVAGTGEEGEVFEFSDEE